MEVCPGLAKSPLHAAFILSLKMNLSWERVVKQAAEMDMTPETLARNIIGMVTLSFQTDESLPDGC